MDLKEEVKALIVEYKRFLSLIGKYDDEIQINSVIELKNFIKKTNIVASRNLLDKL